ncbi:MULTISPECIES: radical SAM protein [Clostridium]|uniref:Radical SAM domain protein n=1 Tax=Clostridium sporogenes TaxID=1509 RepID=A0A7U4LMF7_CLOSG|nr:radical SAM protein [Clostridium sporogenes]AVP59857.1 radical SAM protein [Clostridium botulinum]AKC61724.1 radical SAM domain protein [Clostridium sporogenes]AKJ89038.1 hypothetical protein CLSPOx_05090 [Clostridium sporogenes]KCZ69031.1 radical SAM domain protein [Clostridium sporogenes]MCW6085337.1 radical SAM protein [Clostridium sporogenes]
MIKENLKLSGPSIMSIDITYKCNLRCKHCFNYSGEQDIGLQEMSDDQILKITKDIIKMSPEVVCICGGEPLLRKELIYKITRDITNGTNGITRVNMVTNGLLLNKEIAENLKDSGISFVQVSLDGSNSETYDWLRNKKGAFNKAISAIEILKEVGINVMVSCTPTKKNLSDYENVIKLCEEKGVKEFRVQPLMVLGRATKQLKEYIPSNRDYIKLKQIIDKYKTNVSLSLEWGDPIEHITKGGLDKQKLTYSISVDAYGYIILSPYIPVRLGNINKAWEIPFIKEMCKMIKSTNEMNLNKLDSRIPENFKDKPIIVDILDNRNITKLTLKDVLDNR